MQALPSLQEAALLVKTQPEAGLQVSVVQTLLSLQTTVVPVQAPPTQASPVVQALPSLQEAVLFTWLHEPDTQSSFVQTLLSLQSAGTEHVGAGAV